MPVTYTMIGTGITRRWSASISAPMDGEEEMDVIRRWVDACNQTSTVEGRVAPWERFFQNLFTEKNLPPWDKVVRLHADGKQWTDDVPGYVLEYLQAMEDGSWVSARPPEVSRYVEDLTSVGEVLINGVDLAANACDVDSPIWYACQFFNTLYFYRRARAEQNEESALCRAMDLQHIIEECSVKCRWDGEVEFAQETRQKRKDANAASIQKRSRTRQQWEIEARRRASDFWRNAPGLSITQTAQRIAAALTPDPDTGYRPTAQTVRGYLKEPKKWCSVRLHTQKSASP